MVHYGLGRHSILVTNARALVISTTVTAACYNTGNLSIKLSILYLYRRIFPSHRLKIVFITVGLFAIGQWIAFNFVTIFQCVPIAAQWEPRPDAYCVNYSAASFIAGFLNVITDVIILASPMPAVWHLKVSKARKRLITVTFLLGGCLPPAQDRLVLTGTLRITDNNVPTTQVSGLEISIGTLAGCLPVYRPLYNKIMRTSSSEKTSGSRSRVYGQLSGYQPSIRLEPTRDVWDSNAIPSPSDSQSARHPRLGISTSVRGEGKTKGEENEIINGIMVTREFDTAASAPDCWP
ncbi:MAG: hypothetical protein Q9219_006684 [cf. Caloplaca sp. 3 TL-2023]